MIQSPKLENGHTLSLPVECCINPANTSDCGGDAIPLEPKGPSMRFHGLLLISLTALFGCQKAVDTASSDSPAAASVKLTQIVDQIVEASCGECQFHMEGSGCDLALRIDGETYFVDGTSLDDHGNAHGEDGMCSCVRSAKVSGEIKDGRFISSSFELLPVETPEESDNEVASEVVE